MATLRRLIQDQDVAFDTHQAGDGQPTNWAALHLEKRLRDGGKVRFPFFGNGSPSWDGMSERRYARVVREVHRALHANSRLLDQLAETITRQIHRFKSGDMTIEDARAAASKLAKAFGLGDELASKATWHAQQRLAQFSSLHLGPRLGYVTEIVQSSAGVVLQRPGRAWKDMQPNAL